MQMVHPHFPPLPLLAGQLRRRSALVLALAGGAQQCLQTAGEEELPQ